MQNKYISKYSNNKEVSASQYITELICENKAKIDKKDLHYKFWINKTWSKFFRNQIASANALIKKYGDKPIVRALRNPKAKNIYSLRAPHLIEIIEYEAKKIQTENNNLSKTIDRTEKKNFRKHQSNQNIISKLEELDNGS